MGLDSINLIVKIEQTFGIIISDHEVERMDTVEELIEAVFNKIQLFPTEENISKIVFTKIKYAFIKIGNDELTINPDSIISTLLNTNNLENEWKQLEVNIGLKLPKLVASDFNPQLGKEITFMGIKFREKTRPITRSSLQDLTNWIISLNHHKLINPRKTPSKFDIERIVCGIIEKNLGIPINTIELHHSITNDLGVG
jgi:hypothetical protein